MKRADIFLFARIFPRPYVHFSEKILFNLRNVRVKPSKKVWLLFQIYILLMKRSELGEGFCLLVIITVHCNLREPEYSSELVITGSVRDLKWLYDSIKLINMFNRLLIRVIRIQLLLHYYLESLDLNNFVGVQEP